MMKDLKYNMKVDSFEKIYLADKDSQVRYWFYGIMLFLVIILFLPWTQNIKAKGAVTTLYQEQRPQDIHSPIPGRIVKWYVKEGDLVMKGDTLLQIAEIKEDYLDPNLVGRTRQQLDAKKGALSFYENKVTATATQIEALKQARKLKQEQLRNKLTQLDNKITGEKAELEAVVNEFELTKDQYIRQQKMYDQGLVSQTQLQQRNLSYQNTLAKKIMVENKLAQTRQDILNARLEQNGLEQEYAEKISKAEGDRYQAMSQIAGGQGEVAKLENQLSNYTIRNGMYFILASQDGQMVQASKGGIGEVLKEGERIALIVPKINNYAVEMFVRPVDLPLISVGQKVRFMFDGFPAIIFSGWPNTSYGTFSARVIAFENTISPNGMFRVLVVEDSQEKPWPPQLKVGSGAQGIVLLKDVPIWYELWRNINGFPPDFYQAANDKTPKGGKQ